MRRILTSFILFFICWQAIASVETAVDSIELSLSEKSGNADKITYLLEQSETTIGNDYDLAISLALKAQKLAEKNAYSSLLTEAQLQVARCYIRKADPANAQKSLDLIKSLNTNDLSNDQKIKVLHLESESYIIIGDYLKAQRKILELNASYQKKGDKLGLGRTYYATGYIFSTLDLEEKAIEYYFLALRNFQKAQYQMGIVASFDAIGFSYFEMQELNKAYEWAQKALDALGQKATNKYLFGNIHYNLGLLQFSRRCIDEAQRSFLIAYQLADTIEHNLLKIDARNGLGMVAQDKGDSNTALKYFESAIAIAKSSRIKARALKSYEGLHQVYLKLGKAQAAYQILLESSSLKDSIFQKAKTRRLKYFVSKMEIEENELINAKLSLKIKRQQQRLLLLFASIVLIIFILAGLYSSYYQKLVHNIDLEKKIHQKTLELQKTVKALQDSNQELENFAFISSHDLKEPLRNIISYIKLLEFQIKDQLNGQSKTYFNFVYQSSKQMYKLIEDVLEYARINYKEENPSLIKMENIVGKIEEMIRPNLENKNAEIKISNEFPELKTYPSYLFSVVKNLIENGLKYNNSNHPSVTISYQDGGQHHLIAIEDNGIGIPPKYYDQIFKMFKRLHHRDQYQGSGLGLAICKKIVERLGGEIWVNTAPEQGTVFYFSLPKD